MALLDVREAGQFGEGHALFAVPAPYSTLEARIGALVPRRTTSVVLVDDGDGAAKKAASRIEALGYTNVAVMEGGMPGWAKAGFPVYKGVNVPSKALGELAEAIWHPAMFAPGTLHAWQQQGVPHLFFDARPPSAYARMRVPGARCVPNGELAHRLGAVGAGDEPIVITCAGRTRGIVGAIGLKLAGHPGLVYALENGTQGWALAGHKLERQNRADEFPALSPQALALAHERAAALCRRFGLSIVDTDHVAAMLNDDSRTTYLFDVRSEPETKAVPVPAAIHAPSGQIVQATDQWVGVRRARIVLVDDSGLRAALAAFWLAQLGYEVAVATIDERLRRIPARRDVDIAYPVEVATATAEEALAASSDGSAILIDLRPSPAYRAGHVDGAKWAVRPRLAQIADMIRGRAVCLIADDPAAARLAALDLTEIGAARMALVAGGHAALVSAGGRVVATPASPSDEEAIDHLFFVHDRHDGNLEASRRYLEWETGLIGQMDALERDAFKLFGPAG